LLHRPGVTGPIIGPRTTEQLESNLKALDVQLGAAEMQRLDEIFPGPGGPAPEAYAW
jgi:aryl-alcohol dehydrogenase-like predicted oxidoreductase